jgi:hypothetical protein
VGIRIILVQCAGNIREKRKILKIYEFYNIHACFQEELFPEYFPRSATATMVRKTIQSASSTLPPIKRQKVDDLLCHSAAIRNRVYDKSRLMHQYTIDGAEILLSLPEVGEPSMAQAQPKKNPHIESQPTAENGVDSTLDEEGETSADQNNAGSTPY